MLLHAPGGVMVPLDAVATVATTPGQAEVQRENLRRMVSVTARISGRDLGSTVREIQSTVRTRVPLPRDVSLLYAGTFQTQQQSFAGLLRVLLSAMLFVVIVLLFEFESLRVPLTIFGVNLPALFGVVAALWVTHTTFNISSFVGTILVVGIVAENAIFLMHVVRREQRSGALLETAIIAACHERARPILMTTFAAVLALLPLALGLGTGASIQQSLAIAVIGGFSVSTLLLLFALPMLWSLWGDRSLTPERPRSAADGA
jgi:multidrug efflux pump subunit AcrB